MRQLTKSELETLSRLWDELGEFSAHDGPPMTRDQTIEAAVDALMAGVISSAGRVGREGLAEFEAVLSEKAQSTALQSILDRIAVLLGLAGGIPAATPSRCCQRGQSAGRSEAVTIPGGAAMKHGVLAETFNAEAQRLSAVYDCTYFAQDEPSGRYQELAPRRGSGLVLGLVTSGTAGDLFLTAGARHVGNLEVGESDVKELSSLMRAATAGCASTRNVAVFGRKVALRVRFDDTTWAFPAPFLIGLLPSRDHRYEPWPKRANV